jgi:hypothetical protein
MKLQAQLLLLIALCILASCSEPVAHSATSPHATTSACPTAAQVLNDFVAAFNSGDDRRVADLVGASIQLTDDLPERNFDSQQRQEVLDYLNGRIALGERFLDVVITPGVQTNVAGISYARMTSDGRKLFGRGKAVTSVTDQEHATDCHHLSELHIFGRPQPQP